jgi:hypothetical protein
VGFFIFRANSLLTELNALRFHDVPQPCHR